MCSVETMFFGLQVIAVEEFFAIFAKEKHLKLYIL